MPNRSWLTGQENLPTRHGVNSYYVLKWNIASKINKIGECTTVGTTRALQDMTERGDSQELYHKCN